MTNVARDLPQWATDVQAAGQPAHARMAAKAPYYLHAVIMATIWTVLMSLRHRVGYLYTAEPAVAELAAQALP